jgi:hypothetical protein
MKLTAGLPAFFRARIPYRSNAAIVATPMPSITNTHLSVLWKKRVDALLEVGKNCSALVINASALANN